MSVKRPTIGNLSTKSLLVLIHQYKEDSIFVRQAREELQKRMMEYPIYHLCYLNEKQQDQELKKVLNKVIFVKLLLCDEMLEVCSLAHALQSMSLYQLCVLANHPTTHAIEVCVQRELDQRLSECDEFDQELEQDQKESKIRTMIKRKKERKCKISKRTKD